MKILIDINHPAHVHYFRNFYQIMVKKGHEILFVSRNKEMEHALLNLYKIPFVNRGKGKTGKIGKFLYLLYADIKLMQISRKFKVDVFLNFLHPYPSQVAKLLGKPSLVFGDTEHAKLHHKLTMPYATRVFTPKCYNIDLGQKQVRFRGYMELAYLHPKYFKPDTNILKILGICEVDKYVVVRFVSWTAVHDFGCTGITLENKRKAVLELSKYAKVFISSEGQLPEDLEKFRLKIPFDKMHDVLYYSALSFGESGTMSSEAAVLGTPSVYINSNQLGYLNEQQVKYGLVYNYSTNEIDQEMAIQKALDIIKDENGKEKYQLKRQMLLSECIDTTEFMVNEVLKYNN
jgi:uncharacterized protein